MGTESQHTIGNKVLFKFIDRQDNLFEFFPILYWISLISSLIQLESVNHDWMLLKAVLCLLLTVHSLV